MPALVGPVAILNVGGGNIQFGDTVIISPKTLRRHSVVPVDSIQVHSN